MKKIIIKILILCGVVLPACFLNAQNLNSERGKIGITFSTFGASNVSQGLFIVGAGYYKNSYYYSVGVNYIYPLNNWLGAETGIEYSKYNIKAFSSNYDGTGSKFYGERDLSLIGIPLTLRANFWRFFFANAGTFVDLDFSSKDEIINNQTGMGFVMGLGVNYDFEFGMSLFANPFLRLHSVIPFAQKKHYKRLFDCGVRFGITYDLNKR